MNIKNPYAQAGWFNPANQSSINNGPWTSTNPPPPASIYGALPFSGITESERPDTILQFVFIYESSIFDSTVVGPRNREYFRVTTSVSRTSFAGTQDLAWAAINWSQLSRVQIQSLLEEQPAASWLPLSTNQTQRAMFTRGKWYVWLLSGNSITLYIATHASTPPYTCARITRSEKTTSLEVTSKAVQVGLLEFCIVATVLLQCGKKID